MKRASIYDDFNSYVTDGDPIKFYVGEEKHYGTLIKYGEGTCIVKNEFEQEFEILTEHIHPRVGHDYKLGKE